MTKYREINMNHPALTLPNGRPVELIERTELGKILQQFGIPGCDASTPWFEACQLYKDHLTIAWKQEAQKLVNRK